MCVCVWGGGGGRWVMEGMHGNINWLTIIHSVIEFNTCTLASVPRPFAHNCARF